MLKKKQSRSQSSTKKTLELSSDSSPSPSPRLLSVIRSKLGSGKDLKHIFRGLKSKPLPRLSSQSRIVRCPECQQLLQEPLDAVSYKCGGCDSILHAKRWELEGNDNIIPEAILKSQNHNLSTEVKSAVGGSKTSLRSTHREYNSRESPSVKRSYNPETVYKHETPDIRREWMRKADEFSVTGDSDAFASARSSPYNSRSNAPYNSHKNALEWRQPEGRYEDPHRVPFHPASPSRSSAYEYGFNTHFHGSQVSASEQSYNHQPNQFKQYGRESWFQESSVASPVHYPGETSDGNYYHRSSQSPLHDLQYHNIYKSSSSVAPHHSVYSERSYQAAALPHPSTYSEHSLGISISETSSEKSSLRNKKRCVKERNPVVKRHILPSVGGAPFATCSYCLELLQLPHVSPHGKYKRYQVRCGSCSGVLKFSVREKTDIFLDLPSFVDSGMAFADETITYHQNSASEGHEEIYPDRSYLPCLDNGFGDTNCKSTDVVKLRSPETFEDKRIKEDTKNISNKLLDPKLEASQSHLKTLVNQRLREQQPASSEIMIEENTRIHLEQSQEAHSENSNEIDDNISERVECNLEESEYEKNNIIKSEEISGERLGESLKVPVYKNERVSQSSEEVERAQERVPVSVEPLYKNVYICETHIPSENTKDTHEYDWEDTQENDEFGGESTSKETRGEKPGLQLEKSQYIGDSICDSSSSYGEIFADTAVKEDTEHTSKRFLDVTSATSQSPLKFMVDENPRFIEHPEQLSDATVTISKIYEEQSKYEYEYLHEKQELDQTNSDRIRYDLEESIYETDKFLEPGKLGEDGSIVSLEKVSETFKLTIEDLTGEERLVSHQMHSPNENVQNPYGTLDPVYLEGIRLADERTWEEILEDRAGLHLEEYESNYENCSRPFEWTSERAPTFLMHDYELRTILEPDKDIDGRSESSSGGSFNDVGSSEETVMFRESQDEIPEQSHCEYESSIGRQELSNTVFDLVRSDLQDLRSEKNKTLEQSKIVGDGSVVVVEEAGEAITSETCEERSVSHQMEPQNKYMENSCKTSEPVYLEGNRCESGNRGAETMEDRARLKLEEYTSNPFEWTSQRSPTFQLHKDELGTVLEPEEDVNGRSIPSSQYAFNDHESLNDMAVSQEGTWLVDENKTETLDIGVKVEDGPLHLEKCENEYIKLENSCKTCEPVYLEGNRCESGNRGAETMEDGATLKLEEYTSNPFKWTSQRAPTFQLHEDELGAVLKPEEDANGRSIASSQYAFNDHESLNEIDVSQEGTWLVDENKTETLDVGVKMEDGPLHLEKCENESIKLEETIEWSSERVPKFRLHKYELGEMLESDNNANGISDYNSRGSFSDHGIWKERELFNEKQPPLVIDDKTEALQIGEMEKDKVSLHLEGGGNESGKLDETFEWTSGRTLTFRRDRCEVGINLEPEEDGNKNSESTSRGSFNDRGSSKERAVIHEKGPWLVDDNETKVQTIGVMVEDGPSLHLEKCKIENIELDKTLEPRNDVFRFSLDDTLGKNRMNMMSENKQENPRQTSKQGEVEEDIPAKEEILGDYLEHLQKENENSGLTSEPYAHIYSTTEPSEIVGLRHALYQKQSSPLRSPLTSPIHTPVGSPLHYKMASQIRSPIASPMQSHIVSPLRSPINSPGSLTDVLFFAKNG